MLSPAARVRLVPIIVAIPLMLQNLDTSAVGTALPGMALALGVSPLHLNLAITSYLMSLAVFLPLSSWLSDRLGTRRVFVSAIAVFGLGSTACGFADNITELVAARVFQGMGGAMMLPIGRHILYQTIPREGLVKAMVWFTVPTTLGPLLGPALGGALVTYASWRLVFWMSTPICLIGMALALKFIDVQPPAERSRLNVPSYLMLGFGLACLVFGFETAGRGQLPVAAVAALLLTGAALLTAYTLHARRISNPAIDLSLMEYKPFRASIAGGFLLRTSLAAQPFLLPLLLQIGFGMSAAKSGLITLATAAGSLTTRFFLPYLAQTLGFKRVLIVMTVFVSLLYVVYAQFGPGTPVAVIFAVLAVNGFGRASLMVNLSTMGYSSIPSPRMGRATALAAMAQQLSISFGVTFGASLLNLVLLLRGADALTADDFTPVFLALGALPLVALVWFAPLPADVGDDVSGRKLKTGG